MFIHPQPPHRHISAPCVFAFTPVSGFFFLTQTWHCVCLFYECSSAAGVWSRWQLHYGLRAQGDSGVHEEERGGRRRGTGRVYCRAGPCQFSRQREGGVRRWGGGVAAVSFNEHSLFSSAFNLQSRPSTHERHGGWSLLCRWSPIKSQFIPKPFNQMTWEGCEHRQQNRSPNFQIPSLMCVMKTWEEASFQSRTLK